jgi:hypothetical protein
LATDVPGLPQTEKQNQSTPRCAQGNVKARIKPRRYAPLSLHFTPRCVTHAGRQKPEANITCFRFFLIHFDLAGG